MAWLAGVLAAVLLLLLAGAVYESLSEAADARAYPLPGRMVDVGGYRLHINCIGAGSPTVVMDAGLGAWSPTWALVQPELAKSTRVCAYDRAGMGWSEPGPHPRDARQFARELNALLHNASIPGPYVMAGHSLGGLPVLVFAHDYPAEVAGIVLIDSMHPGQSGYVTQSDVFSALSVAARFGIIRLLVRPSRYVPDVPPAAQAYDALTVRPGHLQTVADEIDGIPASLAQAGAAGSFGDLPLIVISRGLGANAAWEAGQAELAQLSSNSRHLIAERSGHGIQIQQPDAVVAAVLSVIEQVRK